MAIDAAEFKHFVALNWRSIPPGSQDMLIFLDKDLAATIARLNAPRGGGWVVEFELKRSEYEELDLYGANDHGHGDFRINATDTARFNEAVVGELRIIAEFH